MNYKRIILSVFIPYALTCNDARIKDLRDIQYQKQLEISHIENMIAERDVLVRTITTTIAEIVLQLKNENSYGREISGEMIKNELIFCFDHLDNTKNENIQKKVIEELYDKDTFNSLRLHCLRTILEQQLMATFVEKYALCFQELIIINHELDSIGK